jgi:rubrerythrin
MEIEKNESYHRAAIMYNDELAIFAAELSDRLEHPEVARWARSVSNQHKYHARGHKKALSRLERKQKKFEEIQVVDEDTTASIAASQKED